MSGGGGWEGRAVGLLDLDAFFASVEQLDHPEWRGRPVIVGGDADRRGVVSTASYEARAYGVRSAMPSARARRLCPQAVWAPPRFRRYQEVSAQVMAAALEETPRVEQVSIDEAFFDVTPGRFSDGDPVEACRRIAERVASLGVTCSVGLSTSKTVSKIASERNKPNGLTVVFPGTEAEFLAPLPVKVLGGAGPRTCEALERMGVRTLGDLAKASPDALEARLGVAGPRLARRAAGVDGSPVALWDSGEEPKSVSSERTFASDLTDPGEVRTALRYIAGLAARRLRSKGLRGRAVTLKCARAYHEARTATARLASRTDDERELFGAAEGLLAEVWEEGAPVRLLGVSVSGWDEEPEQPLLFDPDGLGLPADVPADARGRAERQEALDRAADALRGRFGEAAAMYGSELRMRSSTTGTPPGRQGRPEGGASRR